MEAELKGDEKSRMSSGKAEKVMEKGNRLEKVVSKSSSETNQRVSDSRCTGYACLDMEGQQMVQQLEIISSQEMKPHQEGQGLEENEAYIDSKMVSDSGETKNPLELGWDKNKRRSTRKKSLVEILKTNHSVLKVSSRKCSKRLPQKSSRTEEKQKLGAN
ncbi:hypothetical protein Ancab_023292 [Ancistrocladus abbreviatus]